MRLNVAFSHNPRLQPLLDGSIQAEGIEFHWQLDHPTALFLEHLKKNAFDAFEFSLSGYIVAKNRAAWSHLGWIALPIFLSKTFWPLEILVNDQSGICTLADLKGKRVGVPDFNMTAAIWLRIMLKQLYGICPEDITWLNGRRPSQRHSTLLGFKNHPSHVVLHEPEEGRSLNELLMRGEIDAAFGDGAYMVPVYEQQHVSRLLSSEQALQILKDFMQHAGITPVNHILVIQEKLLEQSQLVHLLYDTFETSKQEAYRRTRQSANAYLFLPEYAFTQQATLFGEDPYPSGLAANRKMLTMLIEQLLSEGQLSQHIPIENLFAEFAWNT
jgi:4,5-dihydroxyphthalate decarboxylase